MEKQQDTLDTTRPTVGCDTPDDQLLDQGSLDRSIDHPAGPRPGNTGSGPTPGPEPDAGRRLLATRRLRGSVGPLRRGGPILTRARAALAVKMALAVALTASLLLSVADVYISLGLALAFIVTTVLLDYWVYRAVDTLFKRLQSSNRAAEATRSADDLHADLEDLIGGVLGRISDAEALEVETVRADLYRLRGFNNQLLRLGEIAQELNAALPYRETKAKALMLSRQLLSADVVAFVGESGGEFRLEGVGGCEESEITVDCCSYYSRCPMRTAFRDLKIHETSAAHACTMFPSTMRSHLALPFKVDGSVTLCLLAAAAQPGAFADVSEVVLKTLAGHVQTSLAAALRYDRIRREVVTDPLTNLYNRRFFEKRAEEEISRSLRYQEPLSLLMLDVDHFKRVNDTYGHQTGDKVLQSVASFLQASIRQTDICGRFGGEEFVLLLPSTPGRSATFLADRLRAGLGEIMYSGLGIPRDVVITVSGGVATCPRDATSLEDLVAQADRALYEAKDRGRNCIVQAGTQTGGGAHSIRTAERRSVPARSPRA